jgi:hypothetical protein
VLGFDLDERSEETGITETALERSIGHAPTRTPEVLALPEQQVVRDFKTRAGLSSR